MPLSLTNIFFILSISQLLLISVFLLTHTKGKKTSNILLGVFFGSIGLNLLDTFLQFNRLYASIPALAFWGSCLPLLFGPLLYFYVQSMLYRDFEFDWNKWRHLLPFAVLFLLTEAFYLSQTQSFQESLLENLETRNIPIYLPWAAILIFLYFMVYALASLGLIRTCRNEAYQKFSNPVYSNVSSVSVAIYCFMVLMTLAAISQLTVVTPFADYFFGIFSMMLVFVFLFVTQVLIKSMRRTDLFSLVEEAQAPLAGTSGMTDAEKEILLTRLRELMQNEKPYNNPDLTLEQLASQLSVKTKVLSHLLNDTLRQNFFDFINRYRIEEARQLLKDAKDPRITVLEVLYKVGFNSKSSFNTLFKKYTGKTPTEFRKQ
jgi:AraC-like DNA-binding protein